MKYFKYNDLAQLGDLENYSLLELKKIIKSLNYSETEDRAYIYACWTDKYTELKVLYRLNGDFVKIISQKVEVSKWGMLLENIFELFR